MLESFYVQDVQFKREKQPLRPAPQKKLLPSQEKISKSHGCKNGVFTERADPSSVKNCYWVIHGEIYS